MSVQLSFPICLAGIIPQDIHLTGSNIARINPNYQLTCIASTKFIQSLDFPLLCGRTEHIYAEIDEAMVFVENQFRRLRVLQAMEPLLSLLRQRCVLVTSEGRKVLLG